MAAATTATASSTSSNVHANEVVLITGASRGIGTGLVERYAEGGATVIAAARTPATAKALHAVIAKYPKRVFAVSLDVSDAASVATLPQRLAALSPALNVTHIDVLINNAGINGSLGVAETLDNVSRKELAGVFETNVIGSWDTSRVVLPFLRKSAAPRILNVSSLMGSIEFANSAAMLAGRTGAYRISKAALNMLSAVQSAEYNEAALKAAADAKEGKTKAAAAPILTVISVCPGAVDTDMARDFFNSVSDPNMKNAFKSAQNTMENSTTNLVKLLVNAKANPNPKSVFVNHDGTPHKY